MKSITVTRKLKVFSIEDIVESITYIGQQCYFASTIDEFQNPELSLYEFEKINIDDCKDVCIFQCPDSDYPLMAVIEE